jgi:hypothetical protein
MGSKNYPVYPVPKDDPAVSRRSLDGAGSENLLLMSKKTSEYFTSGKQVIHLPS